MLKFVTRTWTLELRFHSETPPPSSGFWSRKVQKHAEICAEKTQAVHSDEPLNNLLSLKQERVSMLSKTHQNSWLYFNVFFSVVFFFTSLLQKLKHFGSWFPQWNLPSVSILTERPADAFSLLCIVSLNIIVRHCQSPFFVLKIPN